MELMDGLTDDEATRKKKQNIVVEPSPSTSSWTQVTTGSGAQGTRDSIPGAPVVPVVNGGLAGSAQQPVAANIVQTKLDQNTFTYVPFVVRWDSGYGRFYPPCTVCPRRDLERSTP